MKTRLKENYSDSMKSKLHEHDMNFCFFVFLADKSNYPSVSVEERVEFVLHI